MDLEILSRTERRLGRRPHELLDVREGASTLDVCEAYARLADACHPRRFAAEPRAAARARRVVRQLRLAFRALTQLGPPRDAGGAPRGALASSRVA